MKGSFWDKSQKSDQIHFCRSMTPSPLFFLFAIITEQKSGANNEKSEHIWSFEVACRLQQAMKCFLEEF